MGDRVSMQVGRIRPVLAVMLGIATLLGIVGLASPAGAATVPAPIPSTLFGMHPVPGALTPPVTVSAGSWRLWDSGTSWPQLNPARGVYRWAALDALVAEGQRRGAVDFTIVLGITPTWAASRAGATLPWDAKATALPPRDINDFRTFVWALAAHNRDRLGGAITGFQVWNEMNLGTFWQGSPALLAQMTADTDVIVKYVDGTYPTKHRSLVVAPSVLLRGGQLPMTSSLCRVAPRTPQCFFSAYLAELARVEGAGGRHWPVDAFALHSYPRRDLGPEQRASLVSTMRLRLNEAHAPTRELWDTEVNYGLPGVNFASCATAAPCVRRISDAVAAQYVARTYLDSVRLGISRVYWYAWGIRSDVLGIHMTTGTQAAAAFDAVRGWLVGARLRGCANVRGAHVCTLTRSGRTYRVMWTDGAVRRVPVSSLRSVCAVTGRCVTALRSAVPTTVTVGAMPLRVD